MKKHLLLLALPFLLNCKNNPKSSNQSSDTGAKLETFDWLLGNWERVNDKPDRQTIERWKKISNTSYEGHGFTLYQQDTIWQEQISLSKTDTIWSFAVIGKDDSTATVFVLNEIDSSRFACENAQNEFPKRIEYQRKNNSIKAIISGGDMEIPFDFEKVLLTNQH